MAGTPIGYTDREIEIIRDTYPDHGAKATKDALMAEGYDRTIDSVRMKAKDLGVKRDMSKRHMENVWSDEEISVLRNLYPIGGVPMVEERLRELGYDRTSGAISTRAMMLGVKSDKRRASSGEKLIMNIVLNTELDREIIERLNAQRNRSDYIRRLVMADIEREQR